MTSASSAAPAIDRGTRTSATYVRLSLTSTHVSAHAAHRAGYPTVRAVNATRIRARW